MNTVPNISRGLIWILVFTAWSISTPEVLSQNTKVDTLTDQINRAIQDSTKARLYGLLAWELKFTDVRKALYYADLEIQLGYQNKDLLRLADGYRVKALTLVIDEKIPGGMLLYDSALFYSRKADNLLYEASCYNLMAGMYGDHADYDKAIELYSKGLEVAQKSEDLKMIATLSNNLAEVYQLGGRKTELTQQYFLLALQSSIKIQNWPGAGMNSANLAKEYVRIGEKEKAMKEINRTIDLMSRNISNRYQFGTTSHVLASIYFDLGNMKEAEKHALISTQIMDSLKQPDNILRPLTVLTSIYIVNEELEKARSFANRLLDDGLKQNAKLYIRDAYKALSDIARLENNYPEALKMYEQYKAWNDSVFEVGREQSISNAETRSILAQKELEVQYETQRKQHENDNLKKLNHNLREEKILAIIACGIFVILGILLFMQNRQRKKANQALSDEKKVVEKQAREKEVLVHEIHHRVKNNLSMLKSLLYLQSRSTINEETKRILQEAQTRIQSMSMMHQNLYENSEVNDLDFTQFTQKLYTEIYNTFRYQDHEIMLQLDQSPLNLNISKAIPLGLIMNELITNSFKYGLKNISEGVISIQMKTQNDTVIVHFSDNGPGIAGEFDLQKGGFGFKLMGILLDQLDAKMTYHHNEDTSYFNIEIPL